jgi:hypothetical protein
VMSTCTEPPDRTAARAALSRPAAGIAGAGAVDRLAEATGVARAADALDDGGAALLPPDVQPASMPSPSRAAAVSVIALTCARR